MYQNGELDQVMDSFEMTLKSLPVYIGGTTERADKVEVKLKGGRTSKRYENNNYYNNGEINKMFLMFLNGYSAGKCEGRLEAIA